MKATSFNPLFIPQPFATGNNAALTPIERSTGTVPNFEDGIPANFSAPKSQGGSYFQRGMMNAIGHMASANSFFHQCGGYHSFDQEVCDAIGGYPKGCVLHWLTDGKYISVESLVEDNTWDFTKNSIDGVHWRIVSSDAITIPTYAKNKKQVLWSNSAMSITDTFGPISGQVEMPFDGYINYLSSIKTTIGGFEMNVLTSYNPSEPKMTSRTFTYIPQMILAESYFWAVIAVSSPDESGVAPDIVLDTSDPIAGERNCAVFLVDGMGLAASGAGCGVIPAKKGSKIKLFGQETFSRTFNVPYTKTTATSSGTITETLYDSRTGFFSGWTTVEAYPIFGG